jgi:outer membrane usher protein FimD/PapC
LALLISVVPVFAQVEAPEMVITTVTINGKPVAELLAEVENNVLRFDASELVPVLTDWVRPEVLAGLSQDQGDIVSSGLDSQGLATAWDPLALVFSIQVPAALSPVRILAVSRARPKPMGTLYGPEPFSAILNLGARVGYSSVGGVPDYPLFMDTNLYVNLRSWVLELGATGALEEGNPELALTKARVVKDFVPADSRLVAGRIDTPVTGFLSSQALLGLTLQSKSFSGARRLVTPDMENLVLERGGTVRTFLNGALLRSERLDPGAYQLSDLPFSSGLNRVELEVLEPGGQLYRFVQIQPHDEAFLGTGGLDYALAFGFEEGGQSRPMGSAFLRLGLADRIDSSLSFQAGFSSAMLGGGLALSTILGNLSLDAGVSLPTAPEAYPAAYSLASRYRLSFPGRTSLPTLGLSAQFSSQGFSAPRVSYTLEPPAAALKLSGALSTTLPGGFSSSLSAENRRNLDEGTATSAMALTLRRRLAEGLTITGLGSLAFQADGAVKPSLTLTVHSSPVGSGQNFQYSQGLNRMSSSFDLSGPVGISQDTEASLRGRNILGHQDDVTSLAVQSRLRRPYGDFNAAASWDHDPLTGQDSTALSLSASGALVLAGGYLRYTRFVPDSFVVLAPRESLAGTEVELQLGSSSAGIRSQAGRPAVGPVTSYRSVQAYVNLPEASPELTSDETFVVLSPTYRSALVLRPGVKPNLGVGGYLLDRIGRPVPWTIGRLLDQDGNFVDQGFTDSDGRFEFYGLAPGVYSVMWASKPAYLMEITVPSDGAAMIEIGEFQLVD